MVAAAGGGVLDDEVRRRGLGGGAGPVEAVAGLLEGAGEVERLGQLGVEEGAGAEARLHHQQPRRVRGVAGEHEEAAHEALVLGFRGRRGGGRALAAAAGEGAERMGGRGGLAAQVGAEARDGGAEHRGRRRRRQRRRGSGDVGLGPPVGRG